MSLAINVLADPSNFAGGPVAKVTQLRTGNPDRITGQIWAQSAISLCIGQSSDWSRLAHQLFGMNTEERVGALDTWRAWKKSKTVAHTEKTELHPSGVDTASAFRRVMATATVRLSHMSTIAKALDSGLDYSTLQGKAGTPTIESAKNLSIDVIYQIAKTYSTAKAGRVPDTFVVKFGKWLDSCAKAGIPEGDLAAYNATVDLCNKLAPAPAI